MESFTIESLEAPENATAGDTITVNATVTNPNDEEATQDVEFRLQGDLIESQSVTLDGDESDTVEFEVDTTGVEAGEYVHMVLTDEFGEVAFIELTEEDEMDDDTETDEDDADDNETDTDDNDTDETDDYDDNETDDNETDDTDTDSRIPIGVIGPV
ncbi:CARDB domain-containing protein [Saliphagus sp. GCM10025308]